MFNNIKISQYDNIAIWSPQYDIYCDIKKRQINKIKIKIVYILKIILSNALWEFKIKSSNSCS